MKTKFKVGQRVYCKEYDRYGKVISIERNSKYLIAVEFDGGRFDTYTADGRCYMSEPPSLTIPLKDKINKLLDV